VDYNEIEIEPSFPYIKDSLWYYQNPPLIYLVKGDYMEKFSNLKEITKALLNGELEKLKVEYEDDRIMRIEIAYVDHDDYHLFYITEADRQKKQITFIEHYCNYGRDFINLKHSAAFDKALQAYLFENKNDSISN